MARGVDGRGGTWRRSFSWTARRRSELTRPRGLLVWVAMVLGFVGPAAGADKKKPGLFDFQTWKTPVGHQRDTIEQLAPHRMDLDPAPAAAAAGEPRTVRLRIYADRDYRSTVLHWQKSARGQIDRVNRVVEAVFNVRFQIESLRTWEQSHVGASPDTIMPDLEAHDPGRDVDWVLALVTPFRGVATSIHQIGGARILGRHLVLRGMDDEQESLALDREFHLLSPNERDKMYGERRIHKEVVVFLHEWGHTMGALHDDNQTAIMNPGYDAKRAAFSDFEKELISLVLDRRLARPGELYPESEDLAKLLERSPPDEGSAAERANLLSVARQRGRGGQSGDPRGAESGGRVMLDMPAADVAVYNQVVEATNAGRFTEAWDALGPLARKYPKQVAVAALACRLVAGHPAEDQARAACDVAGRLAPADGHPLLDAAAAYVRANDRSRAVPLVTAAAARTKDGDSQTWTRLGSLALAVGALSTAEAALGHVERDNPDRRKLSQELFALRLRIGLPSDPTSSTVSPEEEPDYVAVFDEAARVVGAGGTAARASVDKIAARFPGAPGTEVLRCELDLGAHRAAAASKHCEAALAKFPDATRAHYLLGFIATNQRQTAIAEKHLRRVILLDPQDDNAWRTLARLYRATGAQQRLSDLTAQHEALLSTPLPQ